MPVDDLTVFDFIAVHAKTGEAILVISDHLEWEGNPDHITILIGKVASYVINIQNGGLYELYPDAKNRKILIEVIAKHEPDEKGRNLLEDLDERLKAEGYRFIYRVEKL